MEKYFKCDCNGEAIFVEKYKDEHITEYWFSLYRLGNYHTSLKNRIKWAWQMFWKGRLWTDQVTFNKKTATELRDWLTEIIDE